MKNKALSFFAFMSMILAGCDGYFGKKTDISFIEKPEFQAREVAYVPLFPYWSVAAEPVDIVAGFDELFYIVDAAREELICCDEVGNVLGRKRIQGASSVAQDRKLDLLVCGTKTVNINGVDYNLACLYRIHQQTSGNYGLNNAEITSELVHPFYYTANFSLSDKDVRFGKAGVRPDNSYYLTRRGPDNNPNKLGGPDDAVLLFDSRDQFTTPVSVSTSGGFFRDYFKKPLALSTFVQPPQINVGLSNDFVYTSLDNNNVLKVQHIEFLETEFGSSFEPKILLSGDTSQADAFLSDPFRFAEPYGLTLSGDGTNYIFVSDRLKDSVYLFTFSGLEGVKPPPGSADTKYINVSFGGKGTGAMQFNQPGGIAYFRNILYVADRLNGRICRYKLTTDFR